MDTSTSTIILTATASAAAMLAGWLFKNKTQVPNGFIPALNGLLALPALHWIGGVPWQEAWLQALAIVGASTALYEARNGAKAIGIGAGAVAALAVLAGSANAGGAWVPEIKPYGGPSFIATAYSDDPAFVDNADAPNARARIGFTTPVTKNYLALGPVLVRPALAFTWEARRWPIGSDSSPIGENNEYKPEIFLEIAPGSDVGLFGIAFDGVRTGVMHISNGQAADNFSRSLNAGTADALLSYGDHIKAELRGWYLFNTSSETDPIKYYLNFKAWAEAGGSVYIVGKWPSIQGSFEATLTSQDLELFVPLADTWAVGVYLWVHNGEADGIVDFANNHTSGGAGIGVFGF